MSALACGSPPSGSEALQPPTPRQALTIIHQFGFVGVFPRAILHRCSALSSRPNEGGNCGNEMARRGSPPVEVGEGREARSSRAA